MKIFKKCKKILKDRDKQYGKSDRMFYTTVRMWNAYLQHNGCYNKYGCFRALNSVDVPIMMALHKIAREANEHKEDNIIDAINYLALANKLYERDKT